MATKINFHYAYIIIFCCILIMGVIIGLVMSCAGIFYAPVSTSLGVSKGDFGLYMTFVYACSFFMLSVAGKLIDRYSARWLLTGAAAIVGIVYLTMSQYQEVWQFYIAGGVIGISLSFLLYLSYPVLINRWFNARVGFFIGLCSAASGIGGVLFNPLGGYLLQTYGWRNTYLFFGGIILLIVVPLLGLLLRDRPADMGLQPVGEKVTTENISNDGVTYTTAIKSPVFYAMLVFAFLMIAVSTLNLLLPTYVTSIGFSIEKSAFVASAVMIGVTIGKIALGHINDRNPLMGVFVASIFGIIGFILLMMGRSELLMILLGAFLFGWAYAAVTVQTALLARTVFGTKDYSKIFSNISIALALGGAVMAGLWGYLADFIDFKSIFSIGIVLLTLSGSIGWYTLKTKYLSLKK